MRMLMKRQKCLAAAIGISLTLGMTDVALSDNGESDGNRYFLERYYNSDISAAKAFLDAVVKRGKWSDRSDPLVIVDVRDASEYARGHPEGAMHVPYPRIYRECTGDERTEDGACANGTVSSVGQTPENLFLEVEARIRDKSTRIATLCRTGFRSVLAGNILSNPEEYLGPEYADRGYTNVFNIWEGFVGQPKPGIITSYDPDGPGGADPIRGRWVIGAEQELEPVILPDGDEDSRGFVAYDLDLDNDAEITSSDKDGWRYYQGLPYDTRMLPKLISKPVDSEGFYDAP